jgi:uncharacterized MAPEG superfamily protein
MPITAGIPLTIADWCILIVGLVVTTVFTVYSKISKDFDNSKSREYMEGITGARKRAYWSVLNLYETLPLFAVGVLLAERATANQNHIDMIAIGFVLLRFAYGAAYIANLATLRSLVWMASAACIVALFVSAT